IERDRLAAANALQDELVHLITHDVKSPLTAVIGYVQLGRNALRRGNTEPLPDFLDKIEQSGRSIERLVENLLRLSQMERQGELPPAEVVRLPDLAADVVGTLQTLAENKQQQLRIDEPPGEVATLAPPLPLRG